MVKFQNLVGDISESANNAGRIELKREARVNNPGTDRRPEFNDSVLFNNSAKVLTISTHWRFAGYINGISATKIPHVDVARSYWLGLSNPLNQPIFHSPKEVEDFISERLISDLVEMVQSYKINFDRTPFEQRARLKAQGSAHVPKLYRDWFREHVGNTTYTYKLVKALAEGQKPQDAMKTAGIPPGDVAVIDSHYKAPIITLDEVKEVCKRLESNPIPRELDIIRKSDPQAARFELLEEQFIKPLNSTEKEKENGK